CRGVPCSCREMRPHLPAKKITVFTSFRQPSGDSRLESAEAQKNDRQEGEVERDVEASTAQRSKARGLRYGFDFQLRGIFDGGRTRHIGGAQICHDDKR